MLPRKSVEANANIQVSRKGKRFSKLRYTADLYVNDISTGIHVHARTKRGIDKAGAVLCDQSEAILTKAGLMPWLYQKITAAAEGRPELPYVGQVVYLTKDVGGQLTGAPCLVTESEWDEEDEGCLPENTFPVTVWPLGADGDVAPFPIAMDEYTTDAPEPEVGK